MFIFIIIDVLMLKFILMFIKTLFVTILISYLILLFWYGYSDFPIFYRSIRKYYPLIYAKIGPKLTSTTSYGELSSYNNLTYPSLVSMEVANHTYIDTERRKERDLFDMSFLGVTEYKLNRYISAPDSNYNGSLSTLETAANQQDPNVRHLKQPLILFWNPIFSLWQAKRAMKYCKKYLISKHGLNPNDIRLNSAGNRQAEQELCKITSERSKFIESDLVVFHPFQLSFNDLPNTDNGGIDNANNYERSNQKWIFVSRESPANLKGRLLANKITSFQGKNAALFGLRGKTDKLFPYPSISWWEKQFDWIITYNTVPTSDFTFPYGERLKINDTSDYSMVDMDQFKARKLIVAVVSNCQSKKRLDFIHKLKALIPEMDLFGKCFNNPICVKSTKSTTSKEVTQKNHSCLHNLLSEYKFMVSIENSDNCPDYITEKYWSLPLETGTIPIVGGSNKETYKKLAIPNSYIHIDDFVTISELAEHIKKIGSGIKQLLPYLDWRNRWKYKNSKTDIWCELCYQAYIDKNNKEQQSINVANSDEGILKNASKLKQWWEGCDNYF